MGGGRRASYRMESQSLNRRVETWRAGKVRSKGGYDSISLVTTGNDYSPSYAPLRRRERRRRAARLTLNERFHLKTLPALSRAPTTTRIARVTNARGGLSVGTSADVILPLSRLHLTKNGCRASMRIGPDNYRSANVSTYRTFIDVQKRDEEYYPRFDRRLSFLTTTVLLFRGDKSSCRERY